MQVIKLDGRVKLQRAKVLSLLVFVCRYAALMRASHPSFQSPGAIAVPSNGNRQHNRYQLHKEKKQTKIKTRGSSATVTPLAAPESVNGVGSAGQGL